MSLDGDPRSLLEQCRRCIQEGSGDEALRRANAALAGFEGRGDAVGQADAVRAIVNSMVSLGQVGEAAALLLLNETTRMQQVQLERAFGTLYMPRIAPFYNVGGGHEQVMGQGYGIVCSQVQDRRTS
eukprot:CAMPEP_0204524366 /NCGR_PEP_ID=MMETSP0661-20131031/7340_1 /ASSEMBLY_ACC=CAM_ASM_000606 /TAXON_ID=109239 /ORGANISM="Alexandrium margalefi, Strain AMGDE01CS-322" /LENGTH=126 /DNA_ID=CAMNT_0051530119 /DNA_START=55 /DNA_END=433 /DNA_ORIENTATION=+